jgi:RNA polymerase sigma-70 factor (ECF subfamily)
MVPVTVNGAPGWGQYKRAADGRFAAWAIQVVEIRDGRIIGLNAFLDTAVLFPMFGLPLAVD